MKIQKIDLTLGISLGLLIAILAGVSWLGLAEMARVNNNLEELATRRWAKVELARQALEFSNLNNRITLEIFLLRDRAEIDPLLKRRA
jgi:hypothetical protein